MSVEAITQAVVRALPAPLYTLLFRVLRRILEQDELPALLEAIDHHAEKSE